MQYRANEKYPEPMVEAPNLKYASLLKEDYCGLTSETTAVMLYTYQHISSDKRWKEYANLLHQISIVEMFHLELLGETIILLGGNADYSIRDYQDEINIPWTSSYIATTTDLKRMLEIDIASEVKAIKQYEKHLIEIDDHYIQNLLLRIIEDEKLHVKAFETFYHRYFPKID